MQKGCIWDHIHITWEEVIIRHAQSEIQVRQHMSVPLIDKIRMRKIFTQSVDYTFMVQQGDTWMNNTWENNEQLVSFQIWNPIPAQPTKSNSMLRS